MVTVIWITWLNEFPIELSISNLTTWLFEVSITKSKQGWAHEAFKLAPDGFEESSIKTLATLLETTWQYENPDGVIVGFTNVYWLSGD